MRIKLLFAIALGACRAVAQIAAHDETHDLPDSISIEKSSPLTLPDILPTAAFTPELPAARLLERRPGGEARSKKKKVQHQHHGQKPQHHKAAKANSKFSLPHNVAKPHHAGKTHDKSPRKHPVQKQKATPKFKSSAVKKPTHRNGLVGGVKKHPNQRTNKPHEKPASRQGKHGHGHAGPGRNGNTVSGHSDKPKIHYHHGDFGVISANKRPSKSAPRRKSHHDEKTHQGLGYKHVKGPRKHSGGAKKHSHDHTKRPTSPLAIGAAKPGVKQKGHAKVGLSRHGHKQDDPRSRSGKHHRNEHSRKQHNRKQKGGGGVKTDPKAQYGATQDVPQGHGMKHAAKNGHKHHEGYRHQQDGQQDIHRGTRKHGSGRGHRKQHYRHHQEHDAANATVHGHIGHPGQHTGKSRGHDQYGAAQKHGSKHGDNAGTGSNRHHNGQKHHGGKDNDEDESHHGHKDHRGGGGHHHHRHHKGSRHHHKGSGSDSQDSENAPNPNVAADGQPNALTVFNSWLHHYSETHVAPHPHKAHAHPTPKPQPHKPFFHVTMHHKAGPGHEPRPKHAHHKPFFHITMHHKAGQGHEPRPKHAHHKPKPTPTYLHTDHQTHLGTVWTHRTTQTWAQFGQGTPVTVIYTSNPGLVSGIW